jgi:hypothetical protein
MAPSTDDDAVLDEDDVDLDDLGGDVDPETYARYCDSARAPSGARKARTLTELNWILSRFKNEPQFTRGAGTLKLARAAVVDLVKRVGAAAIFSDMEINTGSKPDQKPKKREGSLTDKTVLSLG